MARQTVATTNERIDKMEQTLDKLTEMMTAVVKAQGEQAKASEKKRANKPWLEPCPDYATAAQKVEYDKLAERAKSQREAVMKATGTESVTAFIPVSRTQDRMPHQITWKVYYSK